MSEVQSLGELADGLAKRLGEAADPNALAYEPASLELARALRDVEPAGYERLVAALKRAKVRTAPWERRVAGAGQRPDVIIGAELEQWLPAACAADPEQAFEQAVLRAAGMIDPAFRPRLAKKLAAAGVDAARWTEAVEAQLQADLEREATEDAEDAARGRPAPGGWAAGLRTGKDGSPLATFGNVCLVLREAPAYAGRISYDEMSLQPCMANEAGVPVPLSDADVGRLREQIEREYDIAPNLDVLTHALLTVAHERAFHPVRRYLAGLPAWDGVRRIEQIATRVLNLPAGDPATRFAAKLLRKFLIAAVKRAREPGCKVDTALVLVGPQGHRKSTFFEVLGGPFFLDCDMDLESKDAVLQMRAGWIVEWGEIERVTGRKQASVVKAFVSRPIDAIRAPYARAVARYPRASVFAGSTNKTDFLVDETGERRFWVIELGATPIDVAMLRQFRDLIWAEAVAAAEKGERWWLDEAADVQTHGELTRAYRHVDPWQPEIERWLRRGVRPWTDNAEVLREALELKKQDVRDEHAARVGRVMAALEWERRRAPRSEDPKRPWRYYPPAARSQSQQALVPDGDPSEMQGGPSGPSGQGTSARIGEGAENGEAPTTSFSEPLSTYAPADIHWDHWDQAGNSQVAQLSEGTGTSPEELGPLGPAGNERGDAWEPTAGGASEDF